MKDTVSMPDAENKAARQLSTDELDDALLHLRSCADILEAIVSEGGVSRHVEGQCFTLAASMRMFCTLADKSLKDVIDELNGLHGKSRAAFPLDL